MSKAARSNPAAFLFYEVEKDAKYQLRDEVRLVSCLLHHDLDLPQQALYGLADLMYRMQDFAIKIWDREQRGGKAALVFDKIIERVGSI